MTELLALRHAESSWNAEGRIHGARTDPPLTSSGRVDALAQGIEIRPRHETAIVWSSDARRAVETAAPIIGDSAAGARITPLLREARAGVLEGLTHKEAARLHPDAYATWIARGDLNGIPGAEAGDEVQARALAFAGQIDQDLDPTGTQVHLAVTHAAFLRSLVNTTRGLPRTRPIDVGHCVVHRMQEPWCGLGAVSCGPRWRPEVLRVATVEGDFVVRRDRRQAAADSSRRLDLAREAAQRAGCPDPALATASLWLGGAPCGTITVRRFVDGQHRTEPLSNEDLDRLLRLLARVNNALGKAEPDAAVPTFFGQVAHYSNGSGVGASKLREMLADRRLAALLGRGETVADLDMHRENILFNGKSVTKIDFDALFRGPRLLPTAAALSTGILLYEDADIEFCLARLDPQLPWRRDRLEALGILMRARALLGLAWFEALLAKDPATGAVCHGYLVQYRECLRRVEGAIAC